MVKDETGDAETIDELTTQGIQVEQRRGTYSPQFVRDEKSAAQSGASRVFGNWQILVGVLGIGFCIVLMAIFWTRDGNTAPSSPD